MNKPVDTQEFWRKRISDAIQYGDVRHSVFRAPDNIWNEIVEDHKSIINKLIPDNCKVLDAGCGYGRLYEYLGGKVDYTGVDFSKDFISVAKRLYPHGNFVIGDLTNLPFEDNYFDWSICISIMIMIVENLGWKKWEQMQNELLRVSKNVLCLEYGVSDTLTSSSTYYVISKNS